VAGLGAVADAAVAAVAVGCCIRKGRKCSG